LSQTAVNERGGARTPLSLVFASAAICCVLLMLTGLFRTLPDAVLAAVVLVAVKGLIDLRELGHLWRVSRLDFAAAAVALAGVLLMGVLDGVVIAVIASLVMLLARVSRPHVAFLGRIPGTDRFSDLARHPNNERIPGVLAFRVQSSLLYFNVDHVLEVVRQRASATSGLRRVICDLSNVPYVDIAGARMLRRLHEELAAAQVDFKMVEAHGPVRDALRAERLDDRVGVITRYISLSDAIADHERTRIARTDVEAGNGPQA
jgi:MFS superfamily sulfate permease-like transporter